MSLIVRPARPDDFAQMSRVLIASITRLCTDDHKDDPATIAAWTANKTEQGLHEIFDRPDTTLFVALRDENVVGVGALTGDTITLNYVDPDHRRTGVSTALMTALEQRMRDKGVHIAHLRSTVTARAFYLALAWVEDAPPQSGRFIDAFPMHKVLD